MMGVQIPSDRPGEDIYRAMRALETQLLTRLEAVEKTMADLGAQVSELKDSQRSETVKTIAAAVLACVTAVTGAVAERKINQPPPTQTVLQRSAYDRHLEFCKSEPDGAARVACLRMILEREADTR